MPSLDLRFHRYELGVLSLSASVAIYLYVNLFLFPATPLLLTGDQVYFWMNAQRMMHGEQIYQDFFQFTPPGTDLLYFAVFKIFGPRIWVTNTVVLVLGIVLSLVCFHIARRLVKGPLAALATLLFATFVYGGQLNATHHWFSILLILIALMVLMGGRSLKRIGVAGALLGLATFFTQTHGIAATMAVGAFLLWEHFALKTSWRNLSLSEAALALAFAATIVALYARYLFLIGPQRLWYFQFTHVRRYLANARAPWLGLPAAPSWQTLSVVRVPIAVYLLLVLIYPAVLVVCLRRRPRGSAREEVGPIALLAFVGFSLLIEVALNPNWLRLYAVSMPAIILLVWIVGKTRLHGPITAFLCLVTAANAVDQIRTTHLRDFTIGDLRGGKLAAAPEAYRKMRWINDHTASGEFFFQAPWPGMYIPLQLRNPVFLDAISTFEETRPEFIERTIRELEVKPVRYILWPRYLDELDLQRPWNYQIERVRSFLNQRYRVAHVFPDRDQIWEPK
jgi:4-amino-4-deoxy-L-arabinose transferase-like glycosyltransferase